MILELGKVIMSFRFKHIDCRIRPCAGDSLISESSNDRSATTLDRFALRTVQHRLGYISGSSSDVTDPIGVFERFVDP
jgi:hypothetical protein